MNVSAIRTQAARIALRVSLIVSLIVNLAACGPKPPAPGPPPVPIHIEPACDLAPAAGLEWIVDVRPREIAEIPDLIPAIGLVFGEERLGRFAASHGGVDLRGMKELCIAHYKKSSLVIVRALLDPERVASAFEARSTTPTPRTLVTPNPRVTRMRGTIDQESQTLLVLGSDAAVLEQGGSGAARAAEAFAFGKLKRAQPALKSAALVRAVEVLDSTGASPHVRVLAPGPFEGDVAVGLGGLLRATTSVAGSARWTGTATDIAVRIVLTGAWGEDAPAASERLAAAFHVLSESPTGHLFGLHHPVRAPFVHVEPEALVLDATFNGMELARGVHAAVDAEVVEILRR